DARDVKTGMTNASLFAYVADGRNGMRVVQLNSPEDADNGGFSPRPHPQLIATYHTDGPAVAISEGIDRDRAVDESGNQIAVFGRRGSRPLHLAEMLRMYKREGAVFSVPEINVDKDIVDFYGPPAGGGAARTSEVGDPSQDRSAHDESTGESAPASPNRIASDPEPGEKPAPRTPDAA